MNINIHEFQAKSLLKEYKINSPTGFVISKINKKNKNLIYNLIKDQKKIVIKSQILSGGRGKGVFKKYNLKGGIKITSSFKKSINLSKQILNNTLVTKQTGLKGEKVKFIYFTKALNIKKEYYFSISMNRSNNCPVIISSKEGGVNIEEIAVSNPDKIIRISIDPLFGIRSYHTLLIGKFLGFKQKILKEFLDFIRNIYTLFIQKDCCMIEINPLIITREDKLYPIDAKISFDQNSTYRQKFLVDFKNDLDKNKNILEKKSENSNLNYIKLDGNIACMVNGAGLAMATMDMIKYHGGSPANFLDVGGNVTEDQVSEALEIISLDYDVKAILINIFGGIVKCDVIAKGIIKSIDNFIKQKSRRNFILKTPIVIRLEGTNSKLGRKIIKNSSIKIINRNSFKSAVKKVVSFLL
jgi:succinyl-CoA synthetase beta subunit